MKRSVMIVAAVTLATVAFSSMDAPNTVDAGTEARQPGAGTGIQSVSPFIRDALSEVLAGPDGEYAARAATAAVIGSYGQTAPFTQLIESRKRHVRVLELEFQKNLIPLPQDRFAGRIPAPNTFALALKAALEQEQRSIALLDRWLPRIQSDPELAHIFTRFRRTAREAHIPALMRAIERDGRPGQPPADIATGDPQEMACHTDKPGTVGAAMANGKPCCCSGKTANPGARTSAQESGEPL